MQLPTIFRVGKFFKIQFNFSGLSHIESHTMDFSPICTSLPHRSFITTKLTHIDKKQDTYFFKSWKLEHIKKNSLPIQRVK